METDPKSRRAFSTKDNYRSYLRRWIIPRWGEVALEEVKAIAVEDWLSPLKKPNGKALAPGTKKKIRDLMHVLYAHAIRYEWIDHNPISAVRQGGQRLSTPSRLSVDQLSQLIFEVLKPRERVMVLLDFGTGLRRGELSGVKWEDIDFGERKLTPRRSIVKQHVGAVKTEKSKNSIPLFRQPTDWVFASPVRQGKFPFWGQALLRHYIRPAAVKAGITKRIGWHTFRHSYSTLLKASGADIKVMQELLRHASTRVTLDTYTQAVTPAKRAAQTVLGAARNTLLCPRCVLH
jgi:integrase